jgi:hypothetical protein
MMTESHYERQRRKAAEQLLKSLAPELRRMMADLQVQQRSVAAAAEVFGDQYSRMMRNVAASVPKLDIPALRLDYQSLFPDVSAIQAETLKSLLPGIHAVFDLQRQQFADLLATAAKALRTSLPPNWLDDSVSFPEHLEQLLLDEGLPLGWVPPADILARLFAAESSADRRRIIGQRWKRITMACQEELASVSAKRLRDHVHFATEATNTLLAGSSASSQALSANLLDSILRAEFEDGDRQKITGQKQRLEIEHYPVRVAIVLGGIWGAHGEYWPNRGDKIPRAFSRHGSAHGVSRRQYSRINAVIALMHVVGLVRLLETDFSGEPDPRS